MTTNRMGRGTTIARTSAIIGLAVGSAGLGVVAYATVIASSGTTGLHQTPLVQADGATLMTPEPAAQLGGMATLAPVPSPRTSGPRLAASRTVNGSDSHAEDNADEDNDSSGIDD